jgi:hypothetical protein
LALVSIRNIYIHNRRFKDSLCVIHTEGLCPNSEEIKADDDDDTYILPRSITEVIAETSHIFLQDTHLSKLLATRNFADVTGGNSIAT